MLIPHPLLGPRDAAEFTYMGEAALMDRPDGKKRGALKKFADTAFTRGNPAGVVDELWFHEHGDRSWLVVTRDTVTHAIIKTRLASEVAGGHGRRRSK